MRLLNYDSFIFGPINSLDYGVYVLDVEEDDWGERDVDTASIQGRSGDLVVDYDKLNNVSLTITVAITKDAERNITALNSELLSIVGYCRLEHSFDRDTFRQARYTGKLSPRVSRHGDLCVAQLRFDCMPQKFWKNGEDARQITIGESSSAKFYKAGRMGELMSDKFKQISGIPYPYEPITILNLGEHSGFDLYTVEVYYSDDMKGKRYVHGYADDDPTTASYTGGSSGYGIITGVMTTQVDGYVWFTTPARWRVLDGDTVIDETYSATTILENVSPFPSMPLIRIQPVLNTAFGNEGVLAINDQDVRLLSEYPSTFDADDVLCIDCKTMSAYREIDNGVKESINQYVILPNKTITLKSGSNTIYTNSKIRSAEIIPRWWSR